MPSVALIALDGAHMAAIATVLDMFDVANRFLAEQYAAVDDQAPGAETKVLTLDGQPCRLANGRRLAADGSAGSDQRFGLVYVAPFEFGDEAGFASRLAGLGPLCAWLRAQHEAGAILAASGAGNAILAETGLLDGQVVTAPWWLERFFRGRYKRTILDLARIVVEEDRILLGGTFRSEPALALRLVGRLLSPNVENWVAKATLVDPYPDGPEPWSVFSPQVLRQDGLVGRAQHWLQRRFSQKPKMSELAEAMAVSERTLTRRFERSLGMTPLAYLQTLRIEAAKQMLARSRRRIDRIAYLVGYGDLAFFTQVFRQKTGMSPSEYRRGIAVPMNPPAPAHEA